LINISCSFSSKFFFFLLPLFSFHRPTLPPSRRLDGVVVVVVAAAAGGGGDGGCAAAAGAWRIRHLLPRFLRLPARIIRAGKLSLQTSLSVPIYGILAHMAMLQILKKVN
jgi:hypothetical protein